MLPFLANKDKYKYSKLGLNFFVLGVICYVIIYYAYSSDIGKMSVYHKIVTEKRAEICT